MVTLQQWGDAGRAPWENGRVAPREGYPFPIPDLLASTGGFFDFQAEDKVACGAIQYMPVITSKYLSGPAHSQNFSWGALR